MDIFLDPRLPDYFREHDWNRLSVDKQASSEAFGDFLGEKLSVVHGYDLSRVDLDFLSSLDFPQSWAFKKLEVADILRGADAELGDRILRDAFANDSGAYRHFVEQVSTLKSICDELLASILPYPPDQLIVVTRFSETRLENLHFDLDNRSDDHEAIRLYINLDRSPRIWATSYPMTDLVRQGGMRLVAGITDDMPAQTILKRVTTRAFGAWNERASERLSPRHMVYVDPGDIFFLDGRCVSHQVMTGHRVLTVYAGLSHAAHPEMGPTHAGKLRKALAEARKVPVGSETALVNYFDRGQITPVADVKENWASVFGDTSTGRIRRFDERGLRTD